MNELPPASSRSSQRRPLGAAVLAVLVALLLLLGAWILWGPSFRKASDPAGPPICSNNLRQISVAITIYASDHRGAYPPSLDYLWGENGIRPGNLACPYTTDPVPIGTTAAELAQSYRSGRRGSYIYVGAGLTNLADGDVVVAFEIPSHFGRNSDRAANVLYADGHVENQSLSFIAQLLDELEAGHNPPRPAKLSHREAEALYNRRWLPRLTVLRDGTWAAALRKGN